MALRANDPVAQIGGAQYSLYGGGALLNRARQVRGSITKKREVYAILDARSAVMTESRKLHDMLSILLT